MELRHRSFYTYEKSRVLYNNIPMARKRQILSPPTVFKVNVSYLSVLVLILINADVLFADLSSRCPSSEDGIIDPDVAKSTKTTER